MQRLTASLLLALFCLLPAAPLWSAPAEYDACGCCGKKGALCCRRLHPIRPGPQFDAAPSCGQDCFHGMAGIQSSGATLPAAAHAVAIAAVEIAPLPLRDFFVAGFSYLAFLYQRPPPTRALVA
jgi:hypothetical protein